MNFGNFSLATPTTENDIYLSVGGHCHPVYTSTVECNKWEAQFNGKTLRTNDGEVTGTRGKNRHITRDRLFQIGFYPDTSHSMRVRYVQWALLELGPKTWEKIFEPLKKMTSSKERFMIHHANNCIPYQEQAAITFAKMGVVEHAGPCLDEMNDKLGGTIIKSDVATVGLVEAPSQIRRNEWFDNSVWFGRYHFCLVLENNKKEGYVTKKILKAFLSGCIPIYYGSNEVFDIFNREAFVYYDVENPAEAIERVRHLATDEDAYQEVMDQPILANGQKTINEYFSFGDDMGDGSLKRRIHKMMGLPTYAGLSPEGSPWKQQ